VKITTFFYGTNLKGLFVGSSIASGKMPYESASFGMVSLSSVIPSFEEIVIISIFLPSTE
jgi:hypothetical protein